MHIKRLELSGYMGISPDKPLVLDDLKQINLLIGPNNSGKSIVGRFLLLIRGRLSIGGRLPLTVASPQTIAWNEREDQSVKASLWLAAEQQELSSGGASLFEVRDHQVRVPMSASRNPNNTWELACYPQLYSANTHNNSGHWTDTLRIDKGGAETYAVSVLGKDLNSTSVQSINESYTKIFSSVSWFFFDATRSLTRASASSDVDDGSKVLSELQGFAGQADTARKWEVFSNRFRDTLNQLFEPVGIPRVVKAEMKQASPNPTMVITFESNPDLPIRIEHMGSGIQQLLILLAKLLRHGGRKSMIFLEEPETNLHPGLIRALVDVLRQFPQVQFIIASHSNVLLDALAKGDAVFRFHQSPNDGSCHASPCNEVLEQHALLDALGVSASTLLQANCVVWVEGPTDRVYLNGWLREHAPQLVEGRDFAFSYYGGALLSQVTLELKHEDDLSSVIRICRNAVVLMDRDQPHGAVPVNLAQRKKRVIEESAADTTHRLAMLTDGWEIESDIPPEIMLAAVSKLLNLAAPSTTTYDRDKPFEAAVAVNWPADAEKIRERLNARKMDLSRLVIDSAAESGKSIGKPDWLGEMIAFIQSHGSLGAALGRSGKC